MSKNSYQQMIQEEKYFKEIIKLLLDTWKTILIFVVLGFMSSVTYLLVTPKKYEAIAQIKMAQINRINNHFSGFTSSATANNDGNPLGVNIEESSLLLARMRIPSSYSAMDFKACGLDYLKYPAEILANLAKFSPVKGVTSIIELRVQMESRDQALSCAQSLFENIRNSQNQIIKPHIDEAKSLLIKYQTRLEDAKMVNAREDKSGSTLSTSYLVNRDELKFLMEESIRLDTFIAAGDARQAKLVSPIYASDIPVSPSKKIVLMGGLFLGLILGFVFVIGKKALITLKTS